VACDPPYQVPLVGSQSSWIHEYRGVV
jgi:hypothetical protein